MSHFRINRKGFLVIINDDPANHTHTYYGSLLDAINARKAEFEPDVKSPFTMLLVYDEAHKAFNVMTKNAAKTYGSGYRPLYKKRPAVFVKNVEPSFADALQSAGIEYVI